MPPDKSAESRWTGKGTSWRFAAGRIGMLFRWREDARAIGIVDGLAGLLEVER